MFVLYLILGSLALPRMASRSIFLCVLLVVVLCLVLMEKPSDCNTGYGCFYAKASVSRKMLAGLKEKKETVKIGLPGSATSMSGGSLMGSELRNVPSGPDPLHHNGASPKKPISP